jgi:hypothetical protein
MYLAKFFHRPPGDDDRELLLIPGGHPMILGARMHGSVETQTEDFLSATSARSTASRFESSSRWPNPPRKAAAW